MIIAATAIGIAVIGLGVALITIFLVPGTPSTSARWSFSTGNYVYSGPAVAGGTVYVGSDDHKVYALDANIGRLRWSYTTGGPVDSDPAVSGGTVYVGSYDDKVYALDAGS